MLDHNHRSKYWDRTGLISIRSMFGSDDPRLKGKRCKFDLDRLTPIRITRSNADPSYPESIHLIPIWSGPIQGQSATKADPTQDSRSVDPWSDRPIFRTMIITTSLQRLLSSCPQNHNHFPKRVVLQPLRTKVQTIHLLLATYLVLVHRMRPFGILQSNPEKSVSNL